MLLLLLRLLLTLLLFFMVIETTRLILCIFFYLYKMYVFVTFRRCARIMHAVNIPRIRCPQDDCSSSSTMFICKRHTYAQTHSHSSTVCYAVQARYSLVTLSVLTLSSTVHIGFFFFFESAHSTLSCFVFFSVSFFRSFSPISLSYLLHSLDTYITCVCLFF